MNSPIYVQPSNVITVGPVGDIEPGKTTDSKQAPVAAVIRPVPRDSGKDGSLRMDGANSDSGKMHLRSHQLEDYVNWLLDRVEADSSDSKHQRKTTEPTAPDSINPPTTVESTSESASVTRDTQSAQSTTSDTSSDHQATHQQAPADQATQTVHGHSDLYFSTMVIETHTTEGIETSVQTDSDLTTVEPQINPAGHGYSMKSFERIDAAHRPEVVMPTAHVSFMEDQILPAGFVSVPQQHPESEKALATEPISVEDTESFISTVSKAIASVLTEKSEPEFEQKIRTHFESELQARVIETMLARSSSESVAEEHIANDAVPKAKSAPTPKMKQEAEEIAAGILNDSQKEIPSYVAAWDVEDFRWPSVTNRMIVAGGEAIGQLSNSILETITEGHQRVAITGLGRGEGTSSIAISLARWSAACGKKVLLVDGDIASPTLGTDIGLAPNLSWINAVSQSLPPAEVIVRSQKTNLCVMPMSKMVSRVTWPRFIFDNLGELINNVRNHFDLVILDLGPASQVLAELSRPENLVDATLLVHDGIVNSEFNNTRARLESFGLKKIMIAQNRAHKVKASVA